MITAGCALVSALLQNVCWSVTGNRQTQAFRREYLKAVMRQDVGCEWAAELAEKKPVLPILNCPLPSQGTTQMTRCSCRER